jgi:hypothetical protein
MSDIDGNRYDESRLVPLHQAVNRCIDEFGCSELVSLVSIRSVGGESEP